MERMVQSICCLLAQVGKRGRKIESFENSSSGSIGQSWLVYGRRRRKCTTSMKPAKAYEDESVMESDVWACLTMANTNRANRSMVLVPHSKGSCLHKHAGKALHAVPEGAQNEGNQRRYGAHRPQRWWHKRASAQMSWGSWPSQDPILPCSMRQGVGSHLRWDDGFELCHRTTRVASGPATGREPTRPPL